MKKTIFFILIITLGTTFSYSQTAYTISSNVGTPSSNYTLAQNTDHSIHLSVFIDSNASLNGFKTTLDGNHELTWDLTAFNKNEWVELKHDFTTISELVNPVLNIEIIDDNTSGTGFGTFYLDHIKIYDNSSLSVDDNENEISIAPNPVENKLTLKNIPVDSELKLYNILGTEFKANKTGNENALYLDVSSLSSGVYILKVVNKNRSTTKKIIKK